MLLLQRLLQRTALFLRGMWQDGETALDKASMQVEQWLIWELWKVWKVWWRCMAIQSVWWAKCGQESGPLHDWWWLLVMSLVCSVHQDGLGDGLAGGEGSSLTSSDWSAILCGWGHVDSFGGWPLSSSSDWSMIQHGQGMSEGLVGDLCFCPQTDPGPTDPGDDMCTNTCGGLAVQAIVDRCWYSYQWVDACTDGFSLQMIVNRCWYLYQWADTYTEVCNGLVCSWLSLVVSILTVVIITEPITSLINTRWMNVSAFALCFAASVCNQDQFHDYHCCIASCTSVSNWKTELNLLCSGCHIVKELNTWPWYPASTPADALVTPSTRAHQLVHNCHTYTSISSWQRLECRLWQIHPASLFSSSSNQKAVFLALGRTLRSSNCIFGGELSLILPLLFPITFAPVSNLGVVLGVQLWWMTYYS